MPFDKFGIKFFYPTKKTAGLTGQGSGFFWEQNNDITKDDDFDGTGMVRIGKEHDSSDYKVIDESTGEWQFPFNFDSGDGLSLSGPTGHHSGGETHGCQGFTYMINVDLEANPPKFRFRKETYHVQYDNHPDGLWTHPSAPDKIVGGGWFGYGWVRYNKKDGRGAGKDSVICECWWNNDPESDINNWTMLKRVEDKGAGVTNWGVKATCDGEDYQVGTWSNIQFRFKVDASDFSLHPLKPEPDSGPNIHSIGGEDMSFSDSEQRGFGYRNDMPRDIEMKCLFRFNDTSGNCRLKNLSLREIDPTIGFEDEPSTPPPTEQPGSTTTLRGTFKFQWDVNQLRTSPCAGTTGGGGGGTVNTAVFYEVDPDNPRELSNTSEFDNRTRVVEIVTNSTSPKVLHGKTVQQMDVPLAVEGSPSASPVVSAKIWDSHDNVVYTSPTTIDPTTLTGSFDSDPDNWSTFDFSTNTHAMVTGDRIGIEYITTSDTDFVLCGFDDTDPEDNCHYANFEDGDTWDEKPGRDFACRLWA